ncbi:hypothetical protein [Corynebacterium suranareeae]|nr:hypothetical protein [Corynebacterium suranareeae]
MKSFQSLAQQAKQSWSDDAVMVYDAATASYSADINARVRLGLEPTETRTQQND